jgi:hypothetical protein
VILPPECVPPRIAAIVWSVVRGARNHRQVVADLGMSSDGAALRDLREAKQMGLVDFEPHKANTIRPAVEVVAFTPRSKR